MPRRLIVPQDVPDASASVQPQNNEIALPRQNNVVVLITLWALANS